MSAAIRTPLSCCKQCGDHVTLSRFVTDYTCPRCKHRQEEREKDTADLCADLDTKRAGAPLPARERPFWTPMAPDEYCRGREIVREQEALS